MNTLTLGTSAIRQLDGLYSLNDLHAAAGGEPKHQPHRFLRLAQTQALAAEIGHYPDVGSAIKAINGGSQPGTYVCRELVYAYAMWISPAFHLKVIRAFDGSQAAPALPAFDARARAKLINRRAWALAQADYARYQALMEQSLPVDADAAAIHAWTPPPMLPATRIKQALAILGMEGGAA